MIDKLFDSVLKKLNDYLSTKGNSDFYKAVVEDISNHEKTGEGGGETEIENCIVATLVSIEEEPALKNNYPVRQVGSNFVTEKGSVFINVYVLFSANYETYMTGLKIVGEVINFFQSNKKISFVAEEKQMEAVFTLYNIGFENLNNLWTVLGGKYKPSVIYKARLLKFQTSPPEGGSAIVDIYESANPS